ncbi:MAG: DapH/DapD/GlmU-related protein [Anaerolineae bacterium]
MLRQSLDTPWKASIELRRLAHLPYARLYFALAGVTWGKRWSIYGVPLILRHRGSHIRIGDGLTLRSWYASNPLGVSRRTILCTWQREAQLNLGHGVGMTGAVIVAQTRVDIGDRVWIGANSTIIDTDFHPLAPELRQTAPSAGLSRPVMIEEDVFIGMNAIILKGSHVGAGAVIGAGAVVSGDVPARMIVAGNPAQIVGEVRPS